MCFFFLSIYFFWISIGLFAASQFFENLSLRAQSLWHINWYYVIYFAAQILPTSSFESFLRLVSESFWHIPPSCFMDTSLFVGTIRCSRLILYVSYPNHRIKKYYLKGHWFFFKLQDGEETKIWELGVLIATVVLLLL